VNKTVSSVMDLSEPWDNPHGGQVWYVTAFTTDGEVLSAGKKSEDAATELQGLLIEAIGVPQEFELAPDKPTKSGKAKWKILGFGTPGGAATYIAPGVQGGGMVAGESPAQQPSTRAYVKHRSPEPSSEQASIRASVALKAAVDAVGKYTGTATRDINLVLELADAFNAWLFEKTSDASSAYEVGSGTASPVDATNDQAGASEDSGGGVESKGKEPAPPSHTHDWQPTGLHGKLKCEGCGEMRDRAK
jgi:hypothetical protein